MFYSVSFIYLGKIYLGNKNEADRICDNTLFNVPAGVISTTWDKS